MKYAIKPPYQSSPNEGDYSTLADQRMVGRALRKRWNIPDRVKQDAVNCIQTILDPENENSPSQALRLQAVKNLALLDKLNLDQERMHEPIKHIHVNVDQLSQQDLDKQIQEHLDARNGVNRRPLGRIAKAV